MLLENVAHINDLSQKLRDELEQRVRNFGATVRYKFDIANQNPDPTAYNGKVIWPLLYTLDPTRFNITDPYEKREGKSRSKLIALIDGVDESGKPNKFRKVRIHARQRGEYLLSLDNPEHFAIAMFIELHPKLAGGMFADKTKKQLITRIDESAEAKTQRDERKAKKLAIDLAMSMKDEDVIDFADAMAWDSKEDVLVLRNKIEELAENDHSMFNDLVRDGKMKYQAAIKRAIDNGIWLHDIDGGKLSWASTQQLIVVIGPGAEYDKFAEWFMTAGKKADDVYNKLLSLEKTAV